MRNPLKIKKYNDFKISKIYNKYVIKQLYNILGFKFYLSLKHNGTKFYFNSIKTAEWFRDIYKHKFLEESI